jgi:sec-independent protein translocase protein TatA
MPSGMEWLVILVIALLIFGSRLPAMMRSLGGSVKEFKKGMDEGPEKSSTPPAVPPPAQQQTADPTKPQPKP